MYPIDEYVTVLQMKHLLQIKAVMPEALSLSTSTAGLQQPLSSAAKPEPQMFIEMPLLADSGSQATAQVALATRTALCYKGSMPVTQQKQLSRKQ